MRVNNTPGRLCKVWVIVLGLCSLYGAVIGVGLSIAAYQHTMYCETYFIRSSFIVMNKTDAVCDKHLMTYFFRLELWAAFDIYMNLNTL